MNKAKFITSSVNLPSKGITVRFLNEIKDNARNITREVFVKQVDNSDLNNIASDLGYYVGKGRKGMKLSDDGYVEYYSAKVYNKMYWFMKQSSNEYIFTK